MDQPPNEKTRPVKQALRDALDDRGYTTLTPVQEAVLDPALNGADLLVSAQTGSGKTLGFGLSIAPTLLGEAEGFERAAAPLGLVIAPTRELALQVKRELSWLFAKAGAHLASCVGGMDMRDERRALERGAHIVVATPGRLRDHIMRGSIDLSSLRSVVLDEADEMLDLGFREDLEFILGEAPQERQTLLFSATVSKPIAKLAENYQRDAQRIVTKSEKAQHADIAYLAMNVADRDVENAVINTLLFHKAPNTIVFANTRAAVNRLTTRLSNRGFQVVALSGELSQAERTHALQAMRDGRAQVCVATDVAARGIDLPNLDLVVHAELPSNHETLLHRSGRTGRAGRKGVSALVVTKRTRKKAERILNMAKLKADWTTAPSADAVNAREEERMLADETWATPVEASEAETVAKLTAAHDADALAVAYLRLYRSVRSTPEELSDADAKAPAREEFGASIWFSLTGGRDQGAEPRRLLPMLCKTNALTSSDIGAIRVRDAESFVQVREEKAAGFMASLGADNSLEPGVVVTQLDDAPAFLSSGPARGPRPAGKPGGKYGAKPGGKYDDKKGAKPPRKYDDKPPRTSDDKPSAKFGGERDGAPKRGKDSRDDGPRSKKPYNPDEKSYKERKPRHTDGKPTPPRNKSYANASERVSVPGATPPVDWNDAPAPRAKKPKPQDRKGGPKGKGPGGPGGPRRRDDAAHGAPGGFKKPRAAGGPDGPKGPPPPKGKANSKKNKARAAGGGKPGGTKPPYRPKS